MKLALIGNIPDPTGGAEVFLREFLRVFLRRNRDPTVLLRWRRQFFYYFPEFVERVYAPPGTLSVKGRLKIYYLFESFLKKRGENGSHYASHLVDSYKLQSAAGTAILRQEKPELIHAHMLFPNAFFAFEIARALNLPWILTIHGLLEFRLLDRFDRCFPDLRWKALFAKRLRKASAVVVVSEELRRECHKRGIRHVVKIPGAVDTKFFQANGSISRKNILFLGSVRQDKGALLLLKAFERIRDRVSGDLVFVGNNLLDGELIRPWKRDRRVRFLGVQEAQRVRDEIQKSRLMVLPSASEGLPISVLEAMSCETPVLVTPVGDLKNLVCHGENGFLLRNRTVDGLAASILHLSGRNGFAKIGRLARQTAKGYDLHRIVKLYQDLYRDIVHSHKGVRESSVV